MHESGMQEKVGYKLVIMEIAGHEEMKAANVS
jgi:hypothetical protein